MDEIIVIEGAVVKDRTIVIVTGSTVSGTTWIVED